MTTQSLPTTALTRIFTDASQAADGRVAISMVIVTPDSLTEYAAPLAVAGNAQAEMAARQAGEGPAAMLAWGGAMAGLEPVFGDLGQDPRFVQALAQAAQSLRSLGVAGTLSAGYPPPPG